MQNSTPQKPVSRLGKGLASLLPGAAGPGALGEAEIPGKTSVGSMVDGNAGSINEPESANRIPGISLASVDDIMVNPYQPRREFAEDGIEELSNSIRTNGIIQPLVVRKTSEGYQLIAGERRLRAAKRAGIKHVPIVIRRTTDKESLELALIENIQRRDLNCVDQALAYFQLAQDFNLTQEEIAIRVAKDRASVANHLRILKLPQEILEDLKTGVITFGHAKALLSVDDRELQLKGHKEIKEKQLSVRGSEEFMTLLKEEAEAAGKNAAKELSAPKDKQSALKERFASLSQDLTRQWATRVEIKGNSKKGKIVISYGSRDDLERILAAMQKD